LREKDLSSDLKTMVDSLDKREAEIIKMRFGLGGREEMTLEEVSKRFNVTRERIRQLQQVALMKMRRRLAERELPRGAEQTFLS
jgi:RNA polymerase primary sigma factor